jgi:hypothetical protein
LDAITNEHIPRQLNIRLAIQNATKLSNTRANFFSSSDSNVVYSSPRNITQVRDTLHAGPMHLCKSTQYSSLFQVSVARPIHDGELPSLGFGPPFTSTPNCKKRQMKFD